jgi:hypothetical protein
VRDFKKILIENNLRTEALFGPYDPIWGINSKIPRIPFKVYEKQQQDILIPECMLTIEQIKNVVESGSSSLEDYCTKNGLNFAKERPKFHNHRLDQDFEYWAFVAAKIKPKKGDSDSDNRSNAHVVPFLLNPPQRKVVAMLEKMRVNGVPIRIIILKARQWGGSTLIQIYMGWIQTRHKKSWNSLIAAHLNQAASNIRGMYSTLMKNYPLEKMEYGSFEGTQNIKFIKNRNNKITIGSMQTPDSIRSDDISLAHLSEVGLWKKTEGKKPEDLIQSIVGTIPNLPLTLLCLESTAKGIGNYFHETWLKAKENGHLTPCFVPWFEIPDYVIELEDGEAIKIIESLTEYEEYLWIAGATLEGIKWYRMKLAMFNGDTARMASEFPSNDKEAFQSSGQRYFSFSTIQAARQFNMDPLFKGEVYADSLKGPDSIKNMKIDKDPNGNLWVWAMPSKESYKNRYLVTVDIGGRSKSADDSVIKVFDRIWLSEGGMLEVAAVWAGKIDFDHLAWKAVQICKLYGNAYMVPETNKMRENTAEFDEGDQFYTLVDEIIDYYDNIFCRTSPEAIRQGLPKIYGFNMNKQTKPMVLSALNAAYRDGTYAEFDVRACDQADSFENKGNGQTGAIDGAHDDHVIVSALGAWAGLHHMDPCVKIDPVAIKALMRKGPGKPVR